MGLEARGMTGVGAMHQAEEIAVTNHYFGLGPTGRKQTPPRVCSRTVGRPSSGYGKEGPDSVVIDFDRGVVMWGSDPFPIVKSEGATITFKGEEDPTTEGSIDRITGELSAVETFQDAETNNKVFFNLICRPAKPLF
jgi:hypothetical protein